MDMSVDTMIEVGGIQELAEVLRIYDRRLLLRTSLDADARHSYRPQALTERSRTELASLPEVSPVQALAANHRLVKLLTGGRGLLVCDARQQSPQATWDQIGAALGMTRQAAHEAYRDAIVDLDNDTTRARAALDD